MVKRRSISILTPYSKTHYFIDKGVPRGIVYEAGIMLEQAAQQTAEDDASDESARGLRADVPRRALPGARRRARRHHRRRRHRHAGAREARRLHDSGRSNINQVRRDGTGRTRDRDGGRPVRQAVAVRDKSIQFDSLQKINAQLKAAGQGADRRSRPCRRRSRTRTFSRWQLGPAEGHRRRRL